MTSFLASGAAGGAAERDGSGHADPDFASCTSRPMLRGRPLALLLSQAASRYGLTLSQKATLQSVPLIGAASGAVLNAAFLDQYKSVALAHFRLRQLERTTEFRKFRNGYFYLETFSHLSTSEQTPPQPYCLTNPS